MDNQGKVKKKARKGFCIRCGIQRGKSKGIGCSVWGTSYKKHLWKNN